MECTQRLECTQELYDTHTERTCPEQIGFLGICGAKHPVLKGPNKIGRDPQTCSIILNLNSVSRQHAVINVLSSKEFMLMDLDSANRTKLQNKTLQPYIPHPIRNGDTVQFGDIFGIFRLLEEDDALPMTQALEIPETPDVARKYVTKLHKAPTTVIPESPDVSDRDDSFITPSQPVGGRSRLSSSSFIKLNNNKTQTLPGSSPKKYSNQKSGFIDNPNTSLNDSFISLKCDKNVAEDVHEADTQAPNHIANESTDSIYTAETQIPRERVISPSIHSLDTQVPATEHLPHVRKIDGQHEMQLDIYAANKENNRDIFNAETQPFGHDNESTELVHRNKSNVNKTISDSLVAEESKNKLNTSEEELFFEEVDGEIFEDFNSQNILQDELPIKEKENICEQSKTVRSPVPTKRTVSDGSADCEDKELEMLPTQKIPKLPNEENKQHTKIQGETDLEFSKSTACDKFDSSKDCEDIDMALTQIIPELPSTKDTTKDKAIKKNKTKPAKRNNRIQSDSSTDCEDIDLLPTQKIPEKKANDDDDATDCEDDVIEVKTNYLPTVNLIQDDIATQIIDIDDYKPDQQALEDMPTQIIGISELPANSKVVALEDQLTQVIDEVVPKNIQNVKKSFDEIVSPFKIPLQSPIRVKSKEIPKPIPKDKTDKNKSIDADDNYYDCTQDIYEDLLSQRETSSSGSVAASNADDKIVPCSVEDYKVKDKFANIERDLSPTKNHDELENKDVTGGENVAKLKKVPSDSSDIECTPKKVKQFIFTDSDLPDSQEIKTSMISHTRAEVTESSSDSEPEIFSEEYTPFLNRKKKNKPVPKVDLSKMFEKLPERVITRQRKPTFKLLNSEVSKSNSTILKPTYLTEQDQIDGDIITENIKRLKTFGKGKTSKDSKTQESLKEENKESLSRKKTDNKSKETKEKIKVKIEKPKRKDSKSKTESSDRKSAELAKKKYKEDSIDSTSATKPPARQTRSRKNQNDSQNSQERKSISPENLRKEPDNKRKRTNKKQEKERSVSPEIEVRRSKRRQKAKEKEEDAMKAPELIPVSIPKKSMHEQSTVYNISSSSSESPKSLKRSLVEDSEVPSPKRTRSYNTNHSCNSINNASLRMTPARVTMIQHVLLTAFPSAEVKEKLEKLGAVIVTDVQECSMVLTMQIKRTFKLLCAVGLGRPIVGPGWVQACADSNIIVDPWLYLVKDEPAEKRFQFSLNKTLCGKRNFLKGYNVSSTPSVQPNAAEMKLIVECSGGTWKEGGPNWVCVSCSKDNGLWPALRKRGAAVVSTEFILGGVLRQKLDIASNKFS